MSTTMRRLDELQADQALWGLEPGEARELDELLGEHGEEPDESWEQTAAATTAAMMHPMPSLPRPELLDRLRWSAPSALEVERPAPRTARSSWVSPFLAA
ncbi:MAG: hypothetical protein ACYST0_07940, partial [Planctomycetota bacterium]